VVLVSQEKCRGWRFCVSGCPYKKPYYNWNTGKSEKCILCYPRMETGQAPACFHSCVGRIRYIGVLLYDADRIEEITKVPEAELVAAQRSLILDPADPEVIAAAKKNGIDDEWLEAARKSPTYKFVKEWEVALPLHSEFRTLPMLFYIPPLLPVVATTENGNYNVADSEFFGSIETSRIPIQYMASLFSAGNEEIIKKALRILWAVRSSQQASRVGLINEDVAAAQLAEAGITAEIAEEISRLTALPRVADRYVLPPYHREMAIEELTGDTQQHKYEVGFGSTQSPRRGP
jgi:nitrate reductase beta subunit